MLRKKFHIQFVKLTMEDLAHYRHNDGISLIYMMVTSIGMVMQMRGSRRFLINGIMMTLTSLALRGIGVAWNAFVSGKLGAEGMGLYTLIMSVYGLAITAASAGVNLAATRMCAEAIGCEDNVRLRRTLKRCILYALLCGISACCLLFCGAEWIALVWLEDARCTFSLKLLAASLPFIAVSNVLHGYFNAVRRVSRSALTQIFEQLVKIVLTTWLLLGVMPEGIEYACIALVGGGALAETASFAMALILYFIDRHFAGIGNGTCNSPQSGGSLTREMLGITLPIAAAALIRSALTTLEHMLIPRGLRANPATEETALAAYGMLCGMVMPIIMFPTALLYSFTGLLVPEFAESDAKGDTVRIRKIVSRALGMTLLYAIGCAAILTEFSDALGMLIYKSEDAGAFIRLMAPLVPVMYLDHAVDSMLKGLGEQVYSMKVNILDAAMCTLLVWILCPKIGIYGYVVTIYIAEAVNASLSIAKLAKVTDFHAGLGKMLLCPLVCAIGAVATVRLVGFASCVGWVQLTLGCLLLLIVYFSLLMLTRTLTKRDLQLLIGTR